jgi:gliding motility-associated-like protein
MAQNSSDAIEKYRVSAYKNGNGQVISLSNEVEIIPAALLYIPNAFTPNGDGLNDTFGGKGEGITDYNLQIFNRWGNLIFESNDMKNQWDGNYHNEIAPIGVYVYKISAKGPSANGRSKNLINEKGNVTLVL